MVAHFIVGSFSDSEVTTSLATLPYWAYWGDIHMDANSLKLEPNWLLSDQGQDAWSWRNASQVFSPLTFSRFQALCIFSAWTEILTVLQLLLMLLVTKFVVFILIDKLDDGRWCIGDQLSGLSAAQRVVWKITKLPFASSGPTPLLPQFVSVASQIIESNVFQRIFSGWFFLYLMHGCWSLFMSISGRDGWNEF